MDLKRKFYIEKVKLYPRYTDSRYLEGYTSEVIETSHLNGFEELCNFIRKENGGESKNLESFAFGIYNQEYCKVYGESNGHNYIVYHIYKRR